ncbi:MAG: MlaA family lipoprotein [Gammaproteobacteria bacterium]
MRFRLCFRRIVAAFLVAWVVTSSGCATTGSADPRDPLEGINRSLFSFNEFMDEHLFDPIGRTYQAVLPDPIDRAISNAFSNINDIAVIANDFLQFKLGQAFSDLFRLLLNSTIGILGLVDVASDMGLPKHDEDLGQTLARWGFGSGPYIVAPFFGPTTLRDAAGFGIETTFLNPVSYVNPDAYRAGLLSLNYVDFKADLLSAGELVAEAALDEYDFMKNAFFDRRENKIHDREFSPDAIE